MQDVRVRIAPSPTGAPHVGTAYIALFNKVFAKKHGGKFILRIEDTDQSRSHPDYEKSIFESLKWVNLHWDEGPDVGGDYGPYRQSERTEIYRKHAEKLVQKQGAYRCFCTPERLTKMRAEQLERGLSPKYDGKCRHISENIVAQKVKNKETFTVRLKIPRSGKCVFEDRLRGRITYSYKEVDDQVLLKSDGFPTYHLANVVDDHLMKISHVIRGEEWLPSTPKHILLYELFGWEKPEFIHMPLLLNIDGSKLSKRRNPTSIFYYRDAGYLSEALLNYLALMGYSRPNGEEKFTMDEMIEDFDIERISLGGSTFDLVKLNWLSGLYIRDLDAKGIQERLEKWRLNDAFLTKLIPHVQERMDSLGDLIPLCSFLWARDIKIDEAELIPKKRNEKEIAQFLQTFLFAIEESPFWNASFIEDKMREVTTFFDWKIREATQPLFVAITGKRVAPPLFSSMEFVGKDLCRVRIFNAIKVLGGVSKKKLKEYQKKWDRRNRE